MKLINIKDNLIKPGEDKTSINTSNGSISTKGDVYVNNNLVNHAGNKATWLQSVYPVGSIYISVSSTNPATLFGFGTWEQIKDRFLIGAGNKYAVKKTGGNEQLILRTLIGACDNTRSRLAYVPVPAIHSSYSTGMYIQGAANYSGSIGPINHTTPVQDTGQKTDGTNIMNPYYAVYIWVRTA